MWTQKPVLAVGAPLVVFSLHGIALMQGYYQSIAHLDSLMHAMGGAAAALTLGWLLSLGCRRCWWRQPDLWLSRLLLIGCVGLVALGWEVYELLLHPHWQPSIADTVKDQLLGVLGGAVISLFYKEVSHDSSDHSRQRAL